MKVCAVIFDAGNTLVEPDYSVLVEIASRHGVAIDAVEIRDAAMRSRPLINRLIEAHQDSPEDPDLRPAVIDAVLDLLREPVAARPEPMLRELSEALSRFWSTPSPVEGVQETLSGLRSRGIRLGVVSNSDGTVEAQLDGLGLSAYFETIVDSSLVGVEKPDPRIFLIALERMRLAPGQAAYVGDLPAVDVRGARAAGLHPVLFDPADVFPDAGVPRIRSLPQILELIDAGADPGSEPSHLL